MTRRIFNSQGQSQCCVNRIRTELAELPGVFIIKFSSISAVCFHMNASHVDKGSQCSCLSAMLLAARQQNRFDFPMPGFSKDF